MTDVRSWISGRIASRLFECQQERDALRADLRAAEDACGDYLHPHDNLKGSIKNLRQVAMTARENYEALKVDLRACVEALEEARMHIAAGIVTGDPRSASRVHNALHALEAALARPGVQAEREK